jgi:hypothetical protein
MSLGVREMMKRRYGKEWNGLGRLELYASRKPPSLRQLQQLH